MAPSSGQQNNSRYVGAKQFLCPSMASLRVRFAVLLPMAGMLLAAAPAEADTNGPSQKGAQMYCFMRSNGNSHEVSWEASYALIKRQSSGLFKTSPEHAAVMITEAVVSDPGNYPDCGKYLGDLFGGSSKHSSSTNSASSNASSTESAESWDATERYSY